MAPDPRLPERPIRDDGSSALADAQAHLASFASVTLRRLPLYRHLAECAAADPDVAGLLLLARPERRWATLLMAAAHDRVLADHDDPRGEPDPLGAWYRSVTTDPRPVGTGADDPWPWFRRRALEDPAVADAIATRSTQTNEVGRCATTVPALAGIQRDVGRPLALVEVGASAGLNLRLDHYAYRYRPADPDAPATDVLTLEPSGAVALELSSRWRDGVAAPVPDAMPTIGRRVGIDLDPVDVADAAAARWLVACQWPDQIERVDRCRRAVAAARLDPPTLIAGDLLTVTAEQLRSVPSDQHPVVLSTWCLAYLSDEDQRRFVGVLDQVAAERDLTFLYQEQPIEVPGLEPPPRPDGVIDPGPTALCRHDWRGGHQVRAVRLADQHPHGTWARWFT